MTTVTEFLLARIAEDEAAILDHWGSDGRGGVASMFADGREVVNARHVRVLFDPSRVLAECEAKRRIVDYRNQAAKSSAEAGLPIFEAQVSAYDAALRALALPYTDHPDYDEGWRP